MNVLNWREFAPGLYSAGQPTPKQWATIRNAGVHTVLNLRPDDEQPGVDEAALVEQAGLRYLHLPVASGESLDGPCIGAFAKIMDAHPSGLLIHCGSGNRVGALVALANRRRGASSVAALRAGQAAGLTGLLGKVVELLQHD